jgi:galactokinase
VIKALRCQKAEHDFANNPCGIMDQYISAMGKDGNLLLIDCRSREATLVPFGATSDNTTTHNNAPVVVVSNTNVKHSLVESAYRDRVRECREAVSAIQQKYSTVKALRDCTLDMLNEIQDTITETVYKRARHVITEDQRTLATVEALKQGDYISAGQRMTESHSSLNTDYEVSCDELNFLVTKALTIPGVYGSRMTGGGFGGCTVTLLDRAAVSTLVTVLQESYQLQYHRKCDCYIARPSAGAKREDLAGPIDMDKHHHDSSERPIAWYDYAVPITVLAVSLAIGLSVWYKRK